MNGERKTIIAMVIGILVLAACVIGGAWAAIQVAGNALGQNVLVEDPQLAQEVARSIVDYDLPPGYQEISVIDILVGEMVIIEAEQTGFLHEPVIMILQTDSEIGSEQIREQFQRSMSKESYKVSLVEERTITLRGQETSLFIYEGVDYKNEPVRQYITGTFEAKEGQAVVFIAGPVETWEPEEINAFMESIR